VLLERLLPKTYYPDIWEERAEKVLSHFEFRYPDQIDLYEICWKYGIQILPIDRLYFDYEITENIKSFSIPKFKNKRGIIYIRSGLGQIEERIILAEEFSHVYAHHQNQLTDNISLCKTENQAKRMSAYLLMPRYFLRQVRVSSEEESVIIQEIAEHFLVTKDFARYRLELIFHRAHSFLPSA
jgi:hypothetical protein